MRFKMSMDVAIAGMSMTSIKLTIRRRLLLLFLLLLFFPLFAYRFALDLQHLLLENQAQTQQQTVQHLALILQTRPDLWGETVATQKTLPHLDLNTGSIWLVNTSGQTNYVMGYLNKDQTHPSSHGFEWLGQAIIGSLNKVLGQSPLPFSQSIKPEAELIKLGLNHQSSQLYRTDHHGQPLSLMSSSPLYSDQTLLGVMIYEQTLETIFNQTLSHFYYLIGLATLLMFLFLAGVIAYSTSLSKRILVLADEVQGLFKTDGRLAKQQLNIEKSITKDEISELRFQIDAMLKKLTRYDRYLKQLPKTLRHELHNPINRMSLAVESLQKQNAALDFSSIQHGLTQLQYIISALSEASSFEQALSKPTLISVNILPRLLRFFKQVEESLAPGLVVINNEIDSSATVNIRADAFMLEQLFDKILENALEFNDELKPIEIHLFIDATNLYIEISNSGPPLSKGFETQIFEAMISIRSKPSEQTHLGLGLYVASLIAQAHGASLTAYNRKNWGVTFRLALPLLPFQISDQT